MTITLMRDRVTDSTLWVETTDVAQYEARGYVVAEEPKPDPRLSTTTLMRHRVSGKCMWVPTVEIHDYVDQGFEVHEDQNATVEPLTGAIGVPDGGEGKSGKGPALEGVPKVPPPKPTPTAQPAQPKPEAKPPAPEQPKPEAKPEAKPGPPQGGKV